MNLRARLVLIAAVVAVVTGYLMVSGFSAGRVYYHTVDEFAANADEFSQRFVRISGVVAPGTLHWEPTRLDLRFTLASPDGGAAALPVRYDRIKPDLLQENVPVIVEGRVGADGVLAAERVLVKCPSKYEAAQDA